MPACLLEVFREIMQLSSISIGSDYLQKILNNKDIFEYLTKMKDFCQIFPNIEHLQCWIADTKNLLVIVDSLSKLSTLKIKHESKFEPEETFFEFENEALKRDLAYDINVYDPSRLGHGWCVTTLFVSIGNKHTLD